MLLPVLDVVAVIVTEFFALWDITQCTNPDVAAYHRWLAVRVTGMVDEAGGIPCDESVDVVTFVQFENVNGSTASAFRFCDEFIGALSGLRFGETVSDVFNDASVLWNIAFRKKSTAVNGGV